MGGRAVLSSRPSGGAWAIRVLQESAFVIPFRYEPTWIHHRALWERPKGQARRLHCWGRRKRGAISAWHRLVAWADGGEGISEKRWKTVSDDIQDSLSFLQRSPKGGMKLSSKGKVRRTVTSKYNYSITYIPHPTKIEIIGVFRGQDRRVWVWPYNFQSATRLVTCRYLWWNRYG